MSLYSASEIIGKDLFAKQPIILKRVPTDSAPGIYTVAPGGRVGQVYSYLDYKPGIRNSLYWMFYDSANRPYYSEHKEGAYDLNTLKEQGSLSVKEQLAAEAKKSEGTKDFIERILKYGLVAVVGYGIFKTIINKKMK
jgi:hypothetical protein